MVMCKVQTVRGKKVLQKGFLVTISTVCDVIIALLEIIKQLIQCCKLCHIDMIAFVKISVNPCMLNLAMVTKWSLCIIPLSDEDCLVIMLLRHLVKF